MSGNEKHPHPIPNSALDAFDIGSREYVLGNNDAALDQFERAIDLHDDFGDAYYMQSLALFRAGRPDEAVTAMERAAELTNNPILKDYALNRLARESGEVRPRFGKRMDTINEENVEIATRAAEDAFAENKAMDADEESS